MTCTFPGCDKDRWIAGHCVGHYRQIKAGKTLRPLRHRRQQAPKGLSLYDHAMWYMQNYTREVGTCIEWTGQVAVARYGYGYVSHDNRRMYAHQLMWRAFMGEYEKPYEVDHLCRNTMCVSVAHLDLVTHFENIQRRNVAQGWKVSA